jgi:hypothetical protein
MRSDLAATEQSELLLATAFMEEIGADERYIKLPDERVKDLVVGYIHLLTIGTNAKAAA